MKVINNIILPTVCTTPEGGNSMMGRYRRNSAIIDLKQTSYSNESSEDVFLLQ